MSTTETKTTKTKPTHIISQVIGEGKGRWIRVGAGFTNKDGKGLLLVFDAYPVIGRILVREITEKEGAEDNQLSAN